MATEGQLRAIEKMRAAKLLKAQQKANESKPVENQSKHEESNDSDDDMLGFEIEAELKSLYDSGVRTISESDLKTKAPKTYSQVFENYSEQEDNGVETTNYSAIETEQNEYTIEKK
jgi:hypothetical protein